LNKAHCGWEVGRGEFTNGIGMVVQIDIYRLSTPRDHEGRPEIKVELSFKNGLI
jgi:hypothetical protein